jgi:hypothetical protein
VLAARPSRRTVTRGRDHTPAIGLLRLRLRRMLCLGRASAWPQSKPAGQRADGERRLRPSDVDRNPLNRGDFWGRPFASRADMAATGSQRSTQ